MIFATSNTIYTLHTDTAMVFHYFTFIQSV